MRSLVSVPFSLFLGLLLLSGTVACVGGGGDSATPEPPAPTNPWTWPVALDTSATQNSVDPSVAVDGRGNTLAVWSQSLATRQGIMESSYLPGSGWGSGGLLESKSGDATQPRIAMNASGLGTVVWARGAKGSRSIEAFNYIPSVGFDGLVEAVSDGNQDCRLPSVAMDASGNAVAIWTQFDGFHDHVWTATFKPATGWTLPLQVDMATGEDAFAAAVSMGPNGDAVVVWEQTPNLTAGPYAVWACQYVLGQGWTQPACVQYGTGNAGNPAVAVNGSVAQAVWSETSDGGASYRIYGSRLLLSSGHWSVPVPLSAGQAYSDWPTVALDQAGNAIVAWDQEVATNSYCVAAVRGNANGGWTAPQTFAFGDKNAGVPVAALNDAGVGAIVWNRDSGANIDLCGVRFMGTWQTGGWEDGYRISESSAGAAYSPSLAVGAGGRIVTAWTQQNGSGTYHIWSSATW